MNMEENLWNETNKKTRKVINYIERLYPPRDFSWEETIRFNDTKEKALALSNANDMLKIIGYKYGGRDGIFTKKRY